MEIKLPELNFKDVNKFCIEQSTVEKYDDILLDFADITHIDPMLALVLSQTIDTIYAKTSGEKFVKNFDKSFANYIQFYGRNSCPDTRKINTSKGNSNVRPITRVTRELINRRCGENFEIPLLEIQKIAENFSSELAQNDSILEPTLSFIIREIVRNFYEHSEADFVEMCAIYRILDKNLVIGIVDNGIGIEKTLSSNLNYRSIISDASTALRLATSPGYSRNFSRHFSEDYFEDPAANSGYGLYMASRLCARLDGTFTIISGTRGQSISLNHFTNNYVFDEFDSYHSGTAIRIEISSKQKEKAKMFMGQILKEGLVESSKSDNTFTRASSSSTTFQLNESTKKKGT